MAGALQVAEQIRTGVAAQTIELAYNQTPAKVTISAGVCSRFPGAAANIEAMIRQADQQLYAAKAGGRNRALAVQLDGTTTAGQQA